MFKFLKRKIKKFEDKLENELKVELEKESGDVEKFDSSQKQDEILIEDEIKKEITGEKIDEKPKNLKSEEVKIKRVFRKDRVSKEKRKKEEEIDRQIEKSIETELKYTLDTRRSIEKTVEKDGRKTRGISEDRLDDLLWDLE